MLISQAASEGGASGMGLKAGGSLKSCSGATVRGTWMAEDGRTVGREGDSKNKNDTKNTRIIIRSKNNRNSHNC